MSTGEIQGHMQQADLEIQRAFAGYHALLDELQQKLRALEVRVARAKAAAAAAGRPAPSASGKNSLEPHTRQLSGVPVGSTGRAPSGHRRR